MNGILPRERFGALFDALRKRGYRIVGPTVREGAIVYDELDSPQQLPEGWTDEQGPGTYRLKRRPDGALFGHVVGPQSWKKYLFPPHLRLWQATRSGRSFDVAAEPPDDTAFAFLGIRACELAALAVQDRVFREADPYYRARRDRLLLVAVNCGQAASTCFCTSAGGGPRARGGYDLVLTEILEPPHRFLVEAGSEKGLAILADLPAARPSDADRAAPDRADAAARAQMTRSLDPRAREILARNPEHPRWDAVASRCLACANCTMACPTCFCSTVEDVGDLSGDHAERWRTWDSCFTGDFSHLHGGSVRPGIRSRYRQWLTHKLSSWHDQFGSSGCTGCGRCITWCPVGIDLTEEVREIAKGGSAP
jgi:ferredoxin